MLTLCAPVIDQVSVVVPSLVIFEGEAAKFAIVGGVALAGGGEDAVPAGSLPPPPQPSIMAIAMSVFRCVLLMDIAPSDRLHDNPKRTFLRGLLARSLLF
jgi:hypothetical protein